MGEGNRDCLVEIDEPLPFRLVGKGIVHQYCGIDQWVIIPKIYRDRTNNRISYYLTEEQLFLWVEKYPPSRR